MEIKNRVLALITFALFISSGVASAQEPFSIVLLPDTQNYAEKSTYGVYAHQTRWIVNNRSARNIQFVVHLGDVTNHDVAAEWQVADAAHDILDAASVPFSITAGNHDIYPSNAVYARESLINQYFSPQRFSGKSWYGGSFNSANENNYMFFSAGGMQFMVVSLEFTPRKEVVSWANEVIRQHPNHRVIVATHCYQDFTGDYTTGWADGYNIEGREGVDLWEELIQRHSNIFLAASGHIQGVAYRKRTGLNGNVVHEILSDFQSEPVLGNGTALGNGWLRVLTFNPAQDTINIETLTTEAGNSAIFPGGTARLFLKYDQIANPTAEMHNQMNYSISYNMHTAPAYQYSVSDVQYKDRHPHTSLRGNHYEPRVVSADNGNTVVVWEDDRDGNGVHQIYARAFDNDGNALFGERVVNTDAAGEQRNPALAADGAGNFVVVWEDDSDSNGSYQIYARGFNANGSERFPVMTVNSLAAGQQFRPAVSMDDSGCFVVAWEDDQDANGSYQILMRGFNADGSQRFADRTVNSVSAGQQFKPAIAMAPTGEFVVVWEDDQNNDGKFKIMGRGFDANGGARIADFTVNSVATGHQENPAIAMDNSGRFVVAWQDDKDGNGSNQILARGFNANGSQRIADFTVNSVADGQQLWPAIAMDGSGRFVVAWQDDKDANGSYQISARSFNATGSQRRADFTVNSDASGQQYFPAASMDTQARFVVVWQDDMDGDDDFGVLMRNFNF
jgi:Calcineurin-like phosphoesterase